jgi:hypothetical protein
VSVIDRLDHIATELDPVNPALALALDRISDRLEGRTAIEAVDYAKAVGRLLGMTRWALDHFLKTIMERVEKMAKESDQEFDFQILSRDLADLKKHLQIGYDEAEKMTKINASEVS